MRVAASVWLGSQGLVPEGPKCNPEHYFFCIILKSIESEFCNRGADVVRPGPRA